MFKELLKAKRKYVGNINVYPTAVKLNKQQWSELKLEGKALNMNASTSFTLYKNKDTVGSVNGMLVYLDETVTDFEFGFHYKDGFSKEVF